ncbi:MAG: hypothetical protein Q9202_004254, partial [Teloschistes flavicans]
YIRRIISIFGHIKDYDPSTSPEHMVNYAKFLRKRMMRLCETVSEEGRQTSEEEQQQQGAAAGKKGLKDYKTEITTLYLKVHSLAKYYHHYQNFGMFELAGAELSDEEIRGRRWWSRGP